MEQISLHCSEGTLDWLYPQGALRLSLSPRLPSAAVGPGGGGGGSGLITACVKPSGDFHGAQLYLERDGVLELLLGDRGAAPAAPPRVRCFSRLPGERLALYLQATPHQDISRRIAAFRYELRGDWTARLSLDSNRVSSEGERLRPGLGGTAWAQRRSVVDRSIREIDPKNCEERLLSLISHTLVQRVLSRRWRGRGLVSQI